MVDGDLCDVQLRCKAATSAPELNWEMFRNQKLTPPITILPLRGSTKRSRDMANVDCTVMGNVQDPHPCIRSYVGTGTRLTFPEPVLPTTGWQKKKSARLCHLVQGAR